MTDWQLRTLEEVVDFSNGLNFSEKNDGVGLKIVRVKDFGNRHFVDWTELSEINPTGLKISEKVYLEPDDIVIVRSNGNKDLVGRSMIYAGPARTTAFAGFCIRARVRKSQALPKFVHYWLRSPATREKLSREGGGTGIQNVSQGLLKMQGIALPSLAEQERISGTLAALDDKIELNRWMSATLEEMARALYRSWFVDFDPVHARALGQPPAHMDPTTAALFPNSFGVDGLPEGWEMRSIYDFARVQYGAAFKSSMFNNKNDGRPLVRIRDLKNHFAGVYTTEAHKKEHLIQPADTVVGMDGDFTAYSWCNEPALMNQRVCSFLPKEADNRSFVRHGIMPLLKSEEEAAVATTVIHLGKKDIDKFLLPDPGSEILKAFSLIVEPLTDRFVRLGRESITLAALRDTLLPRLMSGELRIREAEKQVEEVI